MPTQSESGIGFDASGSICDAAQNIRTVVRTEKDVTAIGDTELVPAQGAGIRIRVLALFYNSATAVALRLKSAGNNISASFSLGINGDIVLPYLPHGWFQTNPNEALNANQSLAVTSGAQVIWIPTT